MKDYRWLVLWTDYFNSSLSRSEGRKVPLNRCVKEPNLEELSKAAAQAGYNPRPFVAHHPKRSTTSSGYVCVEKTKPKSVALKGVSLALMAVRGGR